MKIINETKWKTAHLRAFASRVAKDELEPRQRKRIRVKFIPAKYHITGYAWIGGNTAVVRVPAVPDKIMLAVVIAHELAHCRGMTGERDMRSSVRYGHNLTREKREAQRQRYAWANELPLEKKAVRKKRRLTGAEHAEAEAAKCEAAIKRWETKRKRAETALKKYRRKLRYYTKRAAALRASQPTE